MTSRWACWIGLHKWQLILEGDDVLRRCEQCGREQRPQLVDFTGGA